jgi:hypothetical protein
MTNKNIPGVIAPKEFLVKVIAPKEFLVKVVKVVKVVVPENFFLKLVVPKEFLVKLRTSNTAQKTWKPRLLQETIHLSHLHPGQM